MRRGHRVLAVAILLLAVLAIAVATARWLLSPNNIARVITHWVERELQAQLALSESPGLRLVPRLELTLSGVRLERGGTLLASAEELRVALPWSMLWSGGIGMESLSLREPVIDWPQLRVLLGELSGTTPSSGTTPRLPDISVGVRVEDGVLLSGADAQSWRLDRIALVTTPLHEGDTFHLDAGARLAGAQSRILSLTLSARPSSTGSTLALDDIVARLVIGPDGRPLADGMAAQLQGSLKLSDAGLAALSLTGQLPGWPEWLPAALGFSDTTPIALAASMPEGDEQLKLSLTQAGHEASASLLITDINDAAESLDRPLVALASLRSQWQIDALTVAGVRMEGVRIDIGTDEEAQAASVEAPADTAGGATIEDNASNDDIPDAAGQNDGR